jgi:hypothetical protein
MARNQISGVLCGILCESYLDLVPGADIFARVSAAAKSALPADPRADLGAMKRVVRTATIEETSALGKGWRVGRTDQQGNFVLAGDGYDGEPLDIFTRITHIPASYAKGGVPLPAPITLFLGTYQPQRRDSDWYLAGFIPVGLWCGIKKKADVWSVFGKVTICQTQQPLVGANVTAIDADITQDDTLGTVATDGTGFYRIDYPGSAFRKGTILDIELFGGPDIYFKVKDGGGNALIDEKSVDGRRAGRADRGPCACIDLCASVGTSNVTAWTGIGDKITIPDASGLNDFSADGFAFAGRYALCTSIDLTGAAPKDLGGTPVEYRFLFSTATTPNGGPPPPIAGFLPIKDTLFAPTLIGQMVRTTPFKIVKVFTDAADLDSDGWLDVQKSIDRTFLAAGLSQAGFVWDDTDALSALNTAALTAAGKNKIAVRFEIRAQGGGPLPGNGTTLNAMVMNNDGFDSALSVNTGGTACDPLHTAPTVKYKAAHPYIQAVSLNVRSNDGAYNVDLKDPPQSLPLSGNTSDALTSLSNPALGVPTGPGGLYPGIPPLKKCTYLVTLSGTPRLHDGHQAIGGGALQQSTFFYDP